jgi:tape measure domain-containing protein
MARNRIEFALRVKDEASHNLQKVSKEVDGLSSALARLGTGILSLATVAEIARQADQYRLLTNRLRIVTKDTSELNVIQKELLKLSRETRSSLTATADLYARVARSSKDLGVSQQDIIDLTSTVNKSIRISGSTAQEAAAGVIQFGQALASSRLSGDELRSVLEQMPRLARAIAEGMGVGIGRLREMGQAGELTADRVIAALQKMGDEIDIEFSKLTPLVSESFTVLEGSVTAVIGEFDEFIGASASVANAVLTMNDQFISLVDKFIDVTDEADELSASTQRVAIAFIVAATTVRIFARSLFDTIGFLGSTVIDAIQTFGEQVATIFFDPAAAQRQGTEFKNRMLEAYEGTFGDLNEQINLMAVDAIAAIKTVMGELDESGGFLEFDLGFRPPSAIGLTTQEIAALERRMKSAMKIFTQTRTPVEAFLTQMKELRALAQEFPEIIDEETFERAREMFVGEVVGEVDDLKDQIDSMARFMERASQRAAENVMDAFADFLFDPFEDGVKGMLKGFLDALRRMLANMVAFQILSNIPGLGTFFDNTRGRAAGGPVTAGQPVLVGERGPELFIPGASGRIQNNSAMKAGAASSNGVQFTTNIDARGADPGLIARLPAIMEQRDKKLMLKMKQLIETGSVRL